jgi:hypothetical protein
MPREYACTIGEVADLLNGDGGRMGSPVDDPERRAIPCAFEVEYVDSDILTGARFVVTLPHVGDLKRLGLQHEAEHLAAVCQIRGLVHRYGFDMAALEKLLPTRKG